MLDKNNGVQSKIIITTLEDLMPKEHFLRDLEKFVDFSDDSQKKDRNQSGNSWERESRTI